MGAYCMHYDPQQDFDRHSLHKFLEQPAHARIVATNHRRFSPDNPLPSGSKKESRKIFAEETENESEKFLFHQKCLEALRPLATVFYITTSGYSNNAENRFSSCEDYSYSSTDRHIVLRVIRI